MWSNASTPLTFAFVRCTASRYGCFIPEDKAPGNARWTAENLRMWRGEKFAPLLQGCTNPPDGSASNLLTRRLISVRSSGRNVWLLAPRILRWLLYFWGGGKTVYPWFTPIYKTVSTGVLCYSEFFTGPNVYCTDPQSTSIHTWRHTPRSEVTLTCKSLKKSPYQNISDVQLTPSCYRNHDFSCCFGLPHWGKNEGWWILKNGCWERYLGTRCRGPESTE